MLPDAIGSSPTTSPATAAFIGRLRGIDGLRALAAIVVYLFHAQIPFAASGDIGVDIFFIISGFVITRSLMSEKNSSGTIHIGAFYIRRAVRLWPALAVMVLTIAIIHPAHLSISYEILPSLLYYSNWTRAFELGGPFVLGHTWTLSIEEQFYLIWPLLLLACLRWRSQTVTIVLVLATASAMWRTLLFLQGHSGHEVFNRLDTRLDGLLIGAALALMGTAAVRRIGMLFPAAVAALAFILYTYQWPKDWLFLGGYFLAGIAAAIVLCRIVSAQQGLLVRCLEWAPLAFFGKISYGFYLWHYPVLEVFPNFGLPLWQKTALDFVITLILAVLSWFLVELPAKRYLLPGWATSERQLARTDVMSHPSRSPSATGA